MMNERSLNELEIHLFMIMQIHLTEPYHRNIFFKGNSYSNESRLYVNHRKEKKNVSNQPTI